MASLRPPVRKALGSAALLVYLALYAAAAATLGAALAARLPASTLGWGMIAYSAVAGIVWIAPLRGLFRWMNRSA